jgi:soluble lytic murein transglycosylase-like protein
MSAARPLQLLVLAFTLCPVHAVAQIYAPSDYDTLVAEQAALHSIRPELVRAVIKVESGFNPLARSPKGAMGLMQLMPGTARDLGVNNPYDPAQNIRGGTAFLRQLLDRYDGDERLALAAYNAGPEAVDRYGRAVPPYRETQDYVRKVGSAAGRFADAEVTRLPAAPRQAGLVIYKSIEIIDGRTVPRYTSEPPASGAYERLQR